jgi:two-component system OmpR family response regulator
MRMLVVDDEACLARAIQRRLKTCEVSVELDPTNATSRVVTAELAREPFDVVLCDFRMPGMNGIAVLTGLRARATAPLRILMSGMDVALDNARDVADAVVMKPFGAQQLLEAIERARAVRATTQMQSQRMRRVERVTTEQQVG